MGRAHTADPAAAKLPLSTIAVRTPMPFSMRSSNDMIMLLAMNGVAVMLTRNGVLE
jgi:hypothetical protein